MRETLKVKIRDSRAGEKHQHLLAKKGQVAVLPLAFYQKYLKKAKQQMTPFQSIAFLISRLSYPS